MKSNSRSFIQFVLLSGGGWLCDFATFTLLVKAFGVPGFIANFVSSFVGVGFVWFTSLKRVFGHDGSARGRHLMLYAAYQFLSILGYSQCVRWMIPALAESTPLSAFVNQPAIAAKIIVTPFNLLTNFMFMTLLTARMRRIPSP